MRQFRTFLFCILCVFISQSARTQVLQVAGSQPGSALVNNLIGSGIVVSNVALNCPTGASGQFIGTGTNLGLASGVLLCSGQITNAVGPNNLTGAGTDNFSPGDANLNTLSGGITEDACALEFDLVANCDTIQIRYVFGSDEYLEFVGTQYNDAFGFFISGPGYAVPTNIAVVPGTGTTPITINSINNVTNSAYYVNNPANSVSLQYDGITTILTAKAAVVPCSTYHIKLVVADVADGILDSGVFLEEGGISCATPQINLAASTSNSASPFAVEGCIDGVVNFTRSGNVGTAMTVNYTLGGTATNGVDFPAVPGSINFAANVASVSMNISPIADGLIEGPETLLIIVSNIVCGQISNDTATFVIQDPPIADAGPDQTICPAQLINVGAVPDPGVTYSWTPSGILSDDTIANPSFSSNTPGNFIFQVVESAFGSCPDSDQVLITVMVPPTSTFSCDTLSCVNDPIQINYTGTGNAAATYLWNFSGSASQTGSGQGPYSILYNVAASYNVSLQVVVGGCSSLVSNQPIVITGPPVLATVPTHVTCYNFTNGSIDLVVAGGTGPFNYFWQGPNNFTSAVEDPSNIAAGNYQVTVFDQVGCSTVTSVTITQPSAINVSIIPVHPTCFGVLDGSATAVVTGGTLPYSFLWAPSLLTANPISNIGAGQHTVLVTDGNGCTYSQSTMIVDPPPIQVTGYATANNCVTAQPNGTATAYGNGSIGPYQYSWNSIPQQLGQTATGLAPGIYTCTVVSSIGCMGSITLTVDPAPAPPVANGGGDVSFCEGEGGALLNGSVTGIAPPYYFSWSCNIPICGLDSIHDDDPIANPTQTATYYLQIIDNNGCSSNIDSVNVIVLPKPIVNAGPDITLCGHLAPCQFLTPNITGAPGPYTNIQWIPTTGLNNANILNACARPQTTTIYSLVVTSANGCTSTLTTTDTLASTTVNVNLVPTANAGPDLDICFNSSTTLMGSGFNAGPQYQYQWSPLAGLNTDTIANPTASPAFTTEYVLVVYSNGCPSYGDTMTVLVHTLPTVDAGSNVDLCLGDETILSGQAFGDPFATSYSFQWSPNTGMNNSGNTQSVTVNPSSTVLYYLNGTSNFGCVSEPDSVLVTVNPSPQADAGENIFLCAGDSAILQGNYSFLTTPSVPANQVMVSWSPGLELSDTTILNPEVKPTSTRYYYLQTGFNACTTRDSVLVTSYPPLAPIAIADTGVICSGDSVKLTASGGVSNPSFVWYPSTGLSHTGNGIIMASPSSSQTYTIVITEGGCKDSTTLNLDVIERPVADFVHSTPNGCEDHEISFLETSTNTLNWIWEFGDGGPIANGQNPTRSFPETGTFLVRLIAVGLGGCTDTSNAAIVKIGEHPEADFISEPPPPVTLTLPDANVQFVNQGINGTQFLWDFGGVGQSLLPNPEFEFIEAGQYFVTLYAINDNGCTDTIRKGPYFVIEPEIFIPNIFSPNGDGQNDIFQVKYNGTASFNMEINDRWGNRLFQTTSKIQGWAGVTNGGNEIPEGVYFYKIRIGEKEFIGNVTLLR